MKQLYSLDGSSRWIPVKIQSNFQLYGILRASGPRNWFPPIEWKTVASDPTCTVDGSGIIAQLLIVLSFLAAPD
jgi:hypothetical protein